MNAVYMLLALIMLAGLFVLMTPNQIKFDPCAQDQCYQISRRQK